MPMKTMLTAACALLITLSFAGCSAEPGSKA
jgi:outer membrane protein assembly factor BamE (lipoprotein component of BamABCDE complex)